MKILHVAVFTPRSTNNWQADGFEGLGHQVIRYDYRSKLENSGKEKRDVDLIQIFHKTNPDLVVFSKCNGINISVIQECNKQATTILWFMDHSHKFDNELILKIANCNFVFCSACTELSKRYNKNSFRLQGGYDPKQHLPINIKKDIDVSFIGSIKKRKDCHVDRHEYYDKIDFESFTGKYGKQHSEIVSRTKINLNFTEGLGTSNRIYKLLASKGFVATQIWQTINEDFEVNKDLITFKSVSDLKKKIQYYLEHEDERNQIAEHGYQTVQKYDNLNYARRIIEVIK